MDPLRPFVADLLATAVPTAIDDPLRAPSRRRGRAGASILIVDDDPALCEGLEDHLVRAGYDTATANSAEAASILFKSVRFDLILCDILMPGRTGLDLIRELRAEHTETAAIMMSGLDDPKVADSAVALGAYGYMVKPFTRNELLIQVRNAVRRVELERESSGRQRGLEERKELLERLLLIQRAVSHGVSLDAVLESVVDGAQQLLNADVVALKLTTEAGVPPTVVASRGVQSDNDPGNTIVADVHDHDEVVGAIEVGSTVAGRTFTEAEREALAIHAEHAGVAIRELQSRQSFHEAFHDQLTKLPNRASFLESLERASGRRAGIILVDLDGFRAARAEFGSTVADQLLVGSAERVQACAPSGATVARLGPDEFGVLLENATVGEVQMIAERLIDAFKAPLRVATGNLETSLSASCGAAWSDADTNNLVRDASVALFRAKRRGQGRWEIFGAAIQRALVAQFDLEADLEGAIERGEIRVVYQPIVDLNTGRVAGFEALARWEHPRRGVLPPLDFIPIAEELGIVSQIGKHVLSVAVDRACKWRDQSAGGDAPWVSVNFSASELERPDFVSVVAAALERSTLPPESLVVEITESVLIGDTEVARSRLEGLRALGARIAIDDFGTGHASLEYLRELPFDILKIAREFCDGADRSPEESALVHTLVKLAQSLELDVIGEGIERLGQTDALLDMGCALGQGYYYGRPLEPEAADSFVEQRRPRPLPGPRG
jgi:diguanylate cyclase (GGDEF)-like protein